MCLFLELNRIDNIIEREWVIMFQCLRVKSDEEKER